jgi:outer membrane protein OmpA-like peptidoglycan-associated protein
LLTRDWLKSVNAMNKTTVQSPSIRLAYVRRGLSFFIFFLACASMWAQKPALKTTKIDTLKTPIPIMGATSKRLPERVVKTDVKADSTSKMPKKEAVADNSVPTPPKMAEEATAKSVDKPVDKSAKTLEKTAEKTVEKATEKGPLSKTTEKMPSPIVAAPKTVAPAPTQAVVPTQATKLPTQVAKTATQTKVNVSPINAPSSGRMGSCIEFYPNKAVISEGSLACLKEMSKLLVTNKNLKLNVAASLLPTEKAADALALKTERAKTIRNYFIQSGIEASRIAVKLTDKMEETPIVITPQ